MGMNQGPIKLTPEQVEEKLLAQTKVQAERKPEEIMAGIYNQSIPLWDRAVDNMSSRQAKRMLKNLVRHPIIDIHTSTPDEMTALQLGDKIMFTKFVMINSVVLEEEARRMAEEQPQVQEGETNNG